MSEIDIENEIWYGEQAETDSVLMANDNSGKAIIMRIFEFKLPPLQQVPSEAQLVEAHKSKITAFLWRDELVPVAPMKAVIADDKLSFRIFATAQAKAGSNVLANPELLQTVLSGNTPN